MFAQIAEGDKGDRNRAFSPIQEDASLGRNHNVPRIKIDVAQNVGQAKVFDSRASLLELVSEGCKVRVRKDGRRLALLQRHPLAHAREKAIDAARECGESEVPASAREEFSAFSNGSDLEPGKSFCRSCPGRDIG